MQPCRGSRWPGGTAAGPVRAWDAADNESGSLIRFLADPHVFMEVSAREGPAQAESEVSMPSGLAHNKPEVRTPKRPAQKESGIRVREELFCQSWWTACGEELFCLTRRSPCRPVQRRPHQRPVRCLDLPQFRQRSRCCVVLCGCMVACQAACEPQLVTSTAGPARHRRW